MMSLINQTSILREAKVVCKIALTMIVQNAVGGRLLKKKTSVKFEPTIIANTDVLTVLVIHNVSL
jgi:hypothetical protein